ncbi:MAG: hypothetical protein IV093_06425 [Rubrivivax sp.]|nr:hypothetical protein [Rubrivivax sp.]
MLRPPPIADAPHILCDWVELAVLRNTRGTYHIADLVRYRDTTRETEDADIEGEFGRERDTDTEGVSGGDGDAFYDSLIEQFAEREEALGSAYPFAVNSRGVVTLHQPNDWGGYMYLFCLLLSYSNDADLLNGTWRPRVDNTIRDLFQACATVAAAAEVRGHAYSFGWPRPGNNPPFLAKLTAIYQHFGDGQVRAVRRRGLSPFAKDEEIDVIAWRPRRDRAAGTIYLLGQVASGGNWMGKAIHGAPIANFHRNWFDPAPASNAAGCIFIPRLVESADPQGTRRDGMDVQTLRYGTIFDRLRLPLMIQEGIQLSLSGEGANWIIERIDELQTVCDWTIDEITALHAHAA